MTATDWTGDGVVSIVLTDGYRLSPYIVDNGSDPSVVEVVSFSLRYAFGVDLDPDKVWLSEPLPDGSRAMNSDWVLYFDCNPDLVLARSTEEQNAYLATRKHLELPSLRWAADLRFMAEQQVHAQHHRDTNLMVSRLSDYIEKHGIGKRLSDTDTYMQNPNATAREAFQGAVGAAKPHQTCVRRGQPTE